MGAWREPTVFDLVRRRLPFFFFLFPVRFVVEEEDRGRMDLEVGMLFGSRRSVEVAGSSLSRSSKIVDSLSSNMFLILWFFHSLNVSSALYYSGTR